MALTQKDLNLAVPVEYVRQNLAVTGPQPKRRRCWAAYELLPTHLDFLTPAQVLAYHSSLTRFFQAFADVAEGVLHMVPQSVQAEELQRRLALQFTGRNPMAAEYCEALASALAALDADERIVQFRFYVWLRLTRDLTLAELFAVLRRRGYKAVTALYDDTIREAQALAWEEEEAALRSRLADFGNSTGLLFRPLTTPQVWQRIRAPFWRGIGDPPDSAGPEAILKRQEGGSFELIPDGSARRLYAGVVDHLQDAQYVRLTQNIDGQPVRSYVSFLTVEKFSPLPLQLPGQEWGLHLQSVGPVELHLRWTCSDFEHTLEQIASQRRRQTDMMGHEYEHNGALSMDTMDGRAEADEIEQYAKVTKSASVQFSLVLAVTAGSPAELQRRTRQVIEIFRGIDTRLAHNTPDQARHFYETVPGSERLIEDYVHTLMPPALATSMLGTTRLLLDPTGVFFATDEGGRPLWLDLSRAFAKLDIAGNIAFVGPKGGGKSAAANYIVYLGVLFGGRAVVLDSAKPERSKWPELLPYLGPYTRVVTLSRSDADRGKLDPFRIFPDRSEAGNHALQQAAFLTQQRPKDIGYDVLMEAMIQVRDHHPQPCMMAMVQALETMGASREYRYRAVAERLATRLRNMARLAWANLLFGDGTGEAIDTSAPLTIIQLDRLRRPPAGKAEDNYTLDEYLGAALMEAVVAWANSWASQDRGIQKYLLADESRFLVNSPYGRDLLEKQALTGRAMGVRVLLVGQNVDHLPADLHQHFTLRLAFGAGNEREASATLEFLGAPDTPENRERLMQLNPGGEKGQCLLRDLDDRVGFAWVYVWDPELLKAFDTQGIKEDKEEESE